MANKEKMKWLLLLMLTALSLWIVLPDHILHMRKPLATDKKKITLGLDLAGGLRYVLEVDQSKLEGRTTAKDAQGRAIEVIRNRIDSMGVAEPNIQAEGDDRVIVELPGLQAKDRDRAIAVIQGVAFLEFRMVHPKNSELIRQLFERNQVPDGYSVVSVADPGEGGHYRGGDYYRRDPSKSSTNDEAAIREAAATFHAPPGYELLLEKHSINGQTLYEPYFVSKTAEIKGDNLKSAGYEYDTMNRPYVTLQLNKPADRKFWNLTKRFSARGSENENPNLPRYLAIVLDGNVISAPHLEDEIPNGQAIIRGNFTFAEAQDLSLVLRSGALPARVKVIEERQVEPSLGADSIAAGKRATMIGCLAVIIFMAGYYFLAGMVANFALIWNVMLLPVTLLIVGAILGMPDPAAASGAINLPTLTLPGIAGIVLTIGMAVDANVLIYERIREEQHLGKDLKSVLQAGYHKAFSAIFDSHVTTIVSAFILFWLGSGAIRGFAVMLAAGIALSLYTSLVVTRMVFNLIQEHTGLKSIKMLELFKNVPHINFIGAWKICAIVSTVVIIGSWAMTLHQGKKVLGVEFTGGTSLSFQFKQEVKVDLIRNTVAAAGIKDAVIQYQTEATTKAGMANKHLQINTGFEESEKTVNAILGTFKAEGYELVKRDSIGPKMSYELAQHAIFAVGIALLLMAVYIGIRFEFPYAIGAIVSLLHDVLVAVGVYCALGEQLSLNI
ncbi:MAG: protein translocase subunit SecD, partial [Kiritimatiellaeota bacterium]|nr:protein translocase subunit SecD [Kiritimatiellota bacterium]